ncbi:MAG: toxin-antitoxin system HicB family antitoxin [Clostridia bacterium]|nr:toxin-antitoxin system HicB family antitoxin [Clostridia bacterium]
MGLKDFTPENYKDINMKFVLRLPKELHKEVSEYSAKHNVSMNTLILNCIQYALNNKVEEEN